MPVEWEGRERLFLSVLNILPDLLITTANGNVRPVINLMTYTKPDSRNGCQNIDLNQSLLVL